MQDSHKKLQNLMRYANEGNTIKDPYPPNVSKLNDEMLKVASAGNFDLLNNTKTDSDASDGAATTCRSYKGIEGLRKLRLDQGNRTYYEPGCGWRYKPSNGTAPEINQGALGTGDGPTFGQANSTDEVTGGTQWLWDLHDAEKTISQAICQSASQCSQLALLGNFADQCGWCKTTNTAIPIITTGGQTFARYKKDTVMGCPSKDILTAGHCSSAASESFRNPASGRSARTQTEGFATLDSLEECDVSPLTRDCVIQAARAAGCSDEGTLINSLQSGSSGDYDSHLQKTPVYQAYKSVALPSITKQTLKDGSVGLTTALNDFYGLITNMGSSNKKLAVSARDLCVKAGTYDSYNFCAEMTPNTIIDQTNIICVQNDWKSRGGTEQGKSYPTLSKWKGKSWSSYDSSTNLILKNLNANSPQREGFVDKAANAKALKDLVGVDSLGSPHTLPMVDVTRGAETVWFDFSSGSVVVLRSYIGAVPYFSDRNYTTKYGLKSPSGKAYTSAFEIRKTTDDTVTFEAITSDGFIISKNQNPFEGTGHSRNDWGGWLKQPATKYVSAPYTIDSDSNGNKTNIFVSKWFTLDSTAVSQLNITTGDGRKVQADQFGSMYITQEPYAPWLQYEICTRPNFQVTTTGFFEKRWNGPCAYSYQDGAPFPSFDVIAKSVVLQTPEGKGVVENKGYMSFNAGSQWYTQAYFHFTAFKSVSLLIRPIANLSVNNSAPVFSHKSPSGATGYNLFLRNNNGVYVLGLNDSTKNVAMNEWNLVVIQYVGDENGVRAFTFTLDTLTSLRTRARQQEFVDNLTAKQQSFTPVIAGAPGDNVANSGRLALGIPDGSTTQSFTGDVAWVHGFRDYITTVDILSKELSQTWISRWPRANL